MFDRIGKYFVDPRRMTHSYILQIALCFMVSGPSFMDSFFNASTANIVNYMQITHEQFSFLISVPALTGVVSAIAGFAVAVYGSTLSALVSGGLSILGSIILLGGLHMKNYATVMVGRIVFNICWSLLQSFQTVLMFKLFRGTTLAWVFSLQIIAIRLGTAGGFYSAGRFYSMADDSTADAFALGILVSSLSLLLSILFAYLYRGSKTARLVRPLMIGSRRTADKLANTKFSLAIPLPAQLVCASIFFYYAGFTPFEVFGVDFFHTQYGMLTEDAGKMMSCLVLISLLSPLIAPMLADTRKQLISMATATVVVAMAMLVISQGNESHKTLALAAMIILGVAHMFVVGGMWLALASVCATENEKANAASIGSAVNCISTCFTSWSTGKLRDIAGNYRWAYGVLSSFVFLAWLVSLTVHCKYKAQCSMANTSASMGFECNSVRDQPIAEYLLWSPVIENHFNSRKRDSLEWSSTHVNG